MSQIRFDVHLIGANSRSKVQVPPDDHIGGYSRVGAPQLPCSPIAPAKVLLKNSEKFPVLFQIHVDQSHRHNNNNNNNNSGGDEEDDVLVHPSRGTVKPGKISTIAVLLPPPPSRDQKKQERDAKSNKKSSALAADSNNNNNNRSRSVTPRRQRNNRVTFADQTSGGNEYNDDDDEDESRRSALFARVKILARVDLSGNTNNKHFQELNENTIFGGGGSEMDEQHSNSHDADDDQHDEHDQHHHHNAESFSRQWEHSLALPDRTIEVTSVKPRVTREDYLNYLIARKLSRCDRLAKRSDVLQVRYDQAVHQIEDFKEAAALDRMRELENGRAMTVPFLLTLIVVVAAFIAGFSL